MATDTLRVMDRAVDVEGGEVPETENKVMLMPGFPCPLCRFPTYSWVEDMGNKIEILCAGFHPRKSSGLGRRIRRLRPLCRGVQASRGRRDVTVHESVATDPTYGRRDFFKDSVLSVAKAAKEYAKFKRSHRNDRHLRCGRIGCGRLARSAKRCFSSGAPSAATAQGCPYGRLCCIPNGTPVIFADQMPCYLCDDMPCIAACATEALLPVAGTQDVRMGVASVSHRVCTAGQGCHACASKCPTDALSMDFDQQRLVVTVERCVGCGMCEHVCRTVNDHMAIQVTPFRLMAPSSRDRRYWSEYKPKLERCAVQNGRF